MAVATPATAGHTAEDGVADLAASLDAVAADTNFSGAIRVDVAGEVLTRAYGLAHRSLDIANTPDTRFAIASAVKGMTALVVVSLIAEGRLALDTTARSILGSDLPLVADDVTLEHLLAHRSGIGDYIDEDDGGDINEYVMPVSVHKLATTEDYLQVLDGFPTKFPAGERFSYCNGGYVLLALLAERASGMPYYVLVEQRVCAPAGMDSTSFLRSDELPGDAAVGYLLAEGLRSNIFHLPVRGTGDGGIYSTVADLHAFWAALFAGALVSMEWVERMVTPRSDVPEGSRRYGLGFWLAGEGDGVYLEGYDAGVSALTMHVPSAALTYTVVSNSSDGAWPVGRLLGETLGA